jgi:broad specificity phosphatase PhoE
LGSGYATTGIAHHEQWGWDLPYVSYRERLAHSDSLSAAAADEMALWRGVLARIENDQTALIVSHGGSIEATIVAACADADVATWGRPFSHLDGIRLSFERDRWISLDWHRYTGMTQSEDHPSVAGLTA